MSADLTGLLLAALTSAATGIVLPALVLGAVAHVAVARAMKGRCPPSSSDSR